MKFNFLRAKQPKKLSAIKLRILKNNELTNVKGGEEIIPPPPPPPPVGGGGTG